MIGARSQAWWDRIASLRVCEVYCIKSMYLASLWTEMQGKMCEFGQYFIYIHLFLTKNGESNTFPLFGKKGYGR